MIVRTGKRRGGRGSGGGGLVGQRWSDVNTWGGVLPTQSTPIEISSGQTIILDMMGAEHGGIDVNGGTLILDPAVNTSLVGPWIRARNGGKILGGTAGAPLTTSHNFTFNGARSASGIATKYTIELGQPADYTIKEAWPSVETPPTADGETITVTYTSATTMTVSSSVAGSLPGATAGVRYNNRISMTPGTGTNGAVYTFQMFHQGLRNTGVQRGLNVDMADIEIYAATPTTLRTRIDGNLAQGTQTIKMVDDISGWQIGDQIALGPTDFRSAASGAVQVLTIAGVNVGTRTVTVNEPVAAARWGVLQYVTDAGLSTTPGTLTNSANFPAEVFASQPKIVDERAWVSYLSRRVNFDGANDSDWTTNGFGVHAMFMGNTSKVQLHGVGMRRCGQRGIFGRYPLHAHIPSFQLPYGGSYPTNGTFIAPVNWKFDRCSVQESSQRGLVLHGVVGMESNDCSFRDITAHCIFTEDGSEVYNKVVNPIIMDQKTAADADALVVSDGSTSSGSAGVWWSNPTNTLTGVVVARSQGVGIWNAVSQPRVLGQTRECAIPDCGWALRFTGGSVPPTAGGTITQGGVSAQVIEVHVTDGFFSAGTAVGAIRVTNITGGSFTAGALTGGGTLALSEIFGAPAAQQIPTSIIHSPVIAFDNNEVIGCAKPGGSFDSASILTGRSHENNRGEILDRRFGFPDMPFRLNFRIFKGEHGYLNRVEGPIYDRCVIADTKRRGFRGQAASIALTGAIPAPLMVRESLNNSTPVGVNVSGITSYHRLLNSRWGIYVNFTEAPLDSSEDTVVPRPQSGADGGDVYTDPIVDFSLWSGLFINSVPFFHVTPPHLGLDGVALGNRHHTFSGVRIGMEGFGVPAGRNVVFNIPFSTFGLTDQVAILPTYQNVVHTAVKFAGIKPYGRNDVPDGNSHGAPLSAYRLNPADNSEVGNWIIADATASNAYVPFHHFAMPCGLPANQSRVRIISPGRTITHQSIGIGNAHDAADTLVLCVQQNAAPTAVWVTTNWNSAYFNSTVPTTPSASATTIIYTPFASYAAFIASSARGYWHDSGNNCTWVRHVGGIGTPGSWVGGAEAAAYKYNYLVIKST